MYMFACMCLGSCLNKEQLFRDPRFRLLIGKVFIIKEAGYLLALLETGKLTLSLFLVPLGGVP